MSCDFSQFNKYVSTIQNAKETIPSVMRAAAAEAGHIFEGTVKPLTPVYSPTAPYHAYDSGSMRRGGALRQAWHTSEVRQNGSIYSVDVINDAKSPSGHEYASDVEYGHRLRKGEKFPVFVNGKLEYRVHKKSYVAGQHFMAKAREETFRGRAIAVRTREKVEQCLRQM